MGFGTALAAALTYLGAHQQRRREQAQQQQTRQDTLNQQTLENRRLDQQAQAEADYRKSQLGLDQDRLQVERTNAHLDPNTGQPYARTALPSSLTKGKTNSPQGTLQQQYAHLTALSRTLSQSQNPQDQAMAKTAAAQASAIATQIRTQQNIDAQNARAAAQRAEQEKLAKMHFGFSKALKAVPSYSNLHPRAGTGRGRASSGVDMDTFNSAQQAIAASKNPAETAAQYRAAAIAAGASPKTVQAIGALGTEYTNKALGPPTARGSALDREFKALNDLGQ